MILFGVQHVHMALAKIKAVKYPDRKLRSRYKMVIKR